jgi:vacuolar-type H+-ATPase subunit D/Vma8
MREELRRTQEEFQMLKEGIQTYQKHHERLLQERDEQLLHSIRAIQETKQLAAPTMESKRHWWQFWK